LWIGLVLASIMLLGCDASEDAKPPERLAPHSAPDSERPTPDQKPLLPGAPWFELPAEWSAQHPILSPNAKPEAHFLGLAEMEAPKNPADGGGRAWLEAIRSATSPDAPPTWHRDPARDERATVEAASSHRFEIGFEVGELGIEEGGLLFLNPEAFWHWSPAQTFDPHAPGYTTATPVEKGVELRASGSDASFVVVGRALEAGERIDFVYGAGERGAQVDRFAERGSEIMIGLDADGDGFREWVDDGARLDVVARPGSRLFAFGPAEIAPGEAFEIVASITDRSGNRARWPAQTGDETGLVSAHFAVRVLTASSLGLESQSSRRKVQGTPDGPMRFELKPAPGEGTIRLRIEGLDALAGQAYDLPPIVARKASHRLVWGDLHGHSQLSDGTGTARDYFIYARDVARLDVIALTDHDHWGPRPLDQAPEAQAEILDNARSFHQPGRFVTLPGYEWTNWLHGHRHVLYFDDSAPIFSALDPATDRPDELWNALRGRPALTFAHHSAGEPVATNWFFPPDPELEPITEIASVHGVSEALDAPLSVRGGIPRGARLGFIGSGDSHDGHPGLAQIDSGQSGLAGIFTTALDRPDLLDAMRRRHTFATNGIRPWLEVSLDDTVMGGTLASGEDDSIGHVLRIRYEATAPIAGIDLIRSGRIATLEAPAELSYQLEREIPALGPAEFHYVRIRQEDGGVAWSSPIFVD
jgi:hypothetical protein